MKQLSNSEKRNIKFIYGHFPFGVHEILPQPSTYVTLLRDPVKRVVSHYFYARRSPSHRLYKIINQERMSLKEYITSRINTELNNGQVRLISGNIDVDYGMCTKEMLERAKSNLENNFSIVGTVENFDKILLAIGKSLGYNDMFYTKVNVNQSKPKEDIDSDIQDSIKLDNELDIELYQHAIKLQGKIFDRLMVDDRLLNFQRINAFYGFYRSCIIFLKSNFGHRI